MTPAEKDVREWQDEAVKLQAMCLEQSRLRQSAEQERDRLRDLIARGYPAMLARAETAEAALNEARADVIGLERAAQERRSGDVVRLLSAALAWFHSERPQTRSGTLPLWVVDGQNALSALTSTEEG